MAWNYKDIIAMLAATKNEIKNKSEKENSASMKDLIVEVDQLLLSFSDVSDANIELVIDKLRTFLKKIIFKYHLSVKIATSSNSNPTIGMLYENIKNDGSIAQSYRTELLKNKDNIKSDPIIVAIMESKAKPLKEEKIKSEEAKANLQEAKSYLGEQRIKDLVDNVYQAVTDKNPEFILFSMYELQRYIDTRFNSLSDTSAEARGKLVRAYQDLLLNYTDGKNQKVYTFLASIAVHPPGKDHLVKWSQQIARDIGIDPAIISTKLFDADTTILRYLTHQMPIEQLLPKIDRLFPTMTRRDLHKKDQSDKNDLLQKLYVYELEHATEIYKTQITLQEKQSNFAENYPKTHVEFLKKHSPELAAKAYPDDQPKEYMEETYQKNKQQAHNELITPLSDKVAFNFVSHIEKLILSTPWKTGLSGIKVYDTKKKLLNTVSPTMNEMLIVIQNTKAIAQNNPGAWLQAFNEIAAIGKKAAINEPKFLGIKLRDKHIQEFFDHFKTAYDNKSKLENDEEKNSPSKNPKS